MSRLIMACTVGGPTTGDGFMSRIETVSSDLKVLVRPGVKLPAQQVLSAAQQATMPESPHQAAISLPPVPSVPSVPSVPEEEERSAASDEEKPAVKAKSAAERATKPKRRRRARKADGTFQKDDPTTPENEAWTD
jgi:hypothetical protein